MKKLKHLARWLIVPVSMLPGACHYELTGPALWSHNSSAAFDVWVFFWIVSFALVFWAIVWASMKPANTKIIGAKNQID